MKKLRILLFLGFFFSPLLGMGQENIPEFTPSRKGWGFGVNYNTWDNNFGLGLTLFYQKDRNQLDLDLYSNYGLTGGTLKYYYYPNDWKKRMDLRVESGLTILTTQYNYYSMVITPFVGYGLRFLVLRHFYFTHSANLGFRYRNYSREWEEGIRYNSVANVNFGLMFNLGSIKWRKK